MKAELYSKEVEESILGKIIVFEECRSYIKFLNERDFFVDINRYIFEILQNLAESNSPIDLLNIKEKAKEKKLNVVEIYRKSVELVSGAYIAVDMQYYVQKLKNYSTRRELERKAREIIEKVREESLETDATEIKKECMEKIAEIQTEVINSREDTMQNVMLETTEDIEKKFRKKADYTYKTGFFELDKATEGLHEQELTIIAARPRSWKDKFCSKFSGKNG